MEKYNKFPEHRWYDWIFLITVGLFVAAVMFVILDTIFLHRFTRIIASLLGAGGIGVIATSVAEDINTECRYSREYRKDPNGYREKYVVKDDKQKNS